MTDKTEKRIKAELKKEAVRRAPQVQVNKGKLGSLLRQAEANAKRNK